MGLLKKNNAFESSEATLPEQRAALREDITVGVCAFVELPNGDVLEGAVRDISERGAKIAGSTEGLIPDEVVRIVFVIQADQKVLYECRIKHVQHDETYFGVEFLSRPKPLDPEYLPVGKEPSRPVAIARGCPECKCEYELGYVVDHVHLTGDRETIVQTSWAAGRPSRAIVNSRITPRPTGRRRVDAYRCNQCGRVEIYAVDVQA